MTPTTPALTIVVPVYNSEGSLPLLVERLEKVLPQIAGVYELILVNDGSRDRSWQVIEQLGAGRPWVRGICMMRNFGQHNALLCGIRAAAHPIIITMDDDLQHPPEEIPLLLAKLDEGYDVVYGTPRELPHSLVRNLLSRFTKRALASAMGIRDIGNISAFRALRTDLRNAFVGFQSPNLLLDVLLSWGTTRFGAQTVEHKPRLIGKSNYNFGKLFNQAMLILTGFSTAPLRLASMMGFVMAVFGIGVLLYVVVRAVIEKSVPGFPFLASIIAIFSGAQLFALGIFGEYLGRMFNRSMDRPTYVVKEQIGAKEDSQPLSGSA